MVHSNEDPKRKAAIKAEQRQKAEATKRKAAIEAEQRRQAQLAAQKQASQFF
jgi:hypothetical protein